MMYTHLSEELSHEYVTFTFYKFGPHTILCIIPTQLENLIWIHFQTTLVHLVYWQIVCVLSFKISVI